MIRIGKLLAVIFATKAAAQIAAAQPVILAAWNGASSSALLAPGSWVSLYGSNFAATAQTAPYTGALPATLGGVSVTMGGMAASLSYVSPTQVNARASMCRDGAFLLGRARSGGLPATAHLLWVLRGMEQARV